MQPSSLSITDRVKNWLENRDNTEKSYYILEIDVAPVSRDDLLGILRYLYDHDKEFMEKIVHMLGNGYPTEANTIYFNDVL